MRAKKVGFSMQERGTKVKGGKCQSRAASRHDLYARQRVNDRMSYEPSSAKFSIRA